MLSAPQLIGAAAHPLSAPENEGVAAAFDRCADARFRASATTAQASSIMHGARPDAAGEAHGFTVVALEADWSDVVSLHRRPARRLEALPDPASQSRAAPTGSERERSTFCPVATILSASEHAPSRFVAFESAGHRPPGTLSNLPLAENVSGTSFEEAAWRQQPPWLGSGNKTFASGLQTSAVRRPTADRSRPESDLSEQVRSLQFRI